MPGDGARDGNALLFSSAQLHWRKIGAVLQADDIQIFVRLCNCRGPVLALQNQGNRDVLCCGQARKQVIILKNEANLVQAEIRQFVAAHIPDVGAFHRYASGIWSEDP